MIKIKVVIWDRYVIKGDFQVHGSNDETVEIFHRKAGVVETGYDHIHLNLRKVTQLNLIQVVHHEHVIFFIVLFEEFFALIDRFLAKSCPRVRNQQSKYFMFLELSDQGESLHEGFRVIDIGFFYLWHLDARYKNLRCPREERPIRWKTTHCEMNVRKKFVVGLGMFEENRQDIVLGIERLWCLGWFVCIVSENQILVILLLIIR